MATDTPPIAYDPANPNMPVDIPAHEADKAERAKRRAAKRPLLTQCLDPEIAATIEARKPTFEWKIWCKYTRKDDKGKMQTYEKKGQVVAQNENDAWAVFCDKVVKLAIGPHEGERTIQKVGKPANG